MGSRIDRITRIGKSAKAAAAELRVAQVANRRGGAGPSFRQADEKWRDDPLGGVEENGTLGGEGEAYFVAGKATSFWKRGSLRSGSNIGSSRSNAAVSGGFAAKGASYGIESNFCKVEMERSYSPMRAATRARMSRGLGPISASFSIGIMAIARSARVSAAALSPRLIFVSARSPIRTKFSGCSLRKGSSSLRA